MRTLAIIAVAALLAGAGCTIEVHQRDPRTIEALDAALANRRADVNRAQRVIAAAATMTARPEDGAWLAQEARNLGALEGAEEARLSAAAFYESQKTDPAK